MAVRMLGLAVGVCVALAGCAPLPPPAPPRGTKLGLTIAQRTLANGLRVVVVEDPRAADVHVTMRYQVGAVNDGAHPGMAHLAEHLTYGYALDGETLFGRLEDRATQFNAATTLDATAYVARAPARELEALLAIEAARLQDRCATLDDAAFAREREVVINELRQRDQAQEIYRLLHEAMYPANHGYRRPIGGSLESVAAITRADACAFLDAYYAPANAVLVISGQLAPAAVDAALRGLETRVRKRAGRAPRPVAAFGARPQYREVPAPVDEDIFVLAWPLPVEPVLQAKVRAIAATLARLVDGEIQGTVAVVELGDARAPLFGLAVIPGDDETYEQAAAGARRGIQKLPEVFQAGPVDEFDRVLFERLKQSAVYRLYASLEDGHTRDTQLARYVLAGHDPRAMVAAELRAVGALTPAEGYQLAATYLASELPTGVTLRPTGKKRGAPPLVRAPIHDLRQHRTPPDPALAHRPADGVVAPALEGMRTRVLANGMRVVLLPIATVPTFDARLVFATGTAAEPAGQRGVALLAAHTLTWNLRFLEDLMPFARAGGMRDTDVDSDRTTFSVQGLDQHLDAVLAGLRRWVRDGTYDDSAASYVSTLRAAAKRADDLGPLTDAWRAALFGAEHPYVRAGLVRHVDVDVTLVDADRFRAAHYTPGNATLVIAGRFDPALADRWIDYLFADWRGSTETRVVPATPHPASLAKVDDQALVQLRVALPAGTAARAHELVAAAMLAGIAREVRHRLGASYTIDAELSETRSASYYVIAGWVDAARTAEAVTLIRDQLRALHTDEAAAARAFVLARRHVLAQLGAQAVRADVLATRAARDVAMGRAPLADLQLATEVQRLTLAAVRPSLAALDLARATMLMNGPREALQGAFAVLGRTPVYVEPAPPAVAAPGATAPAFVAPEQQVLRSQVEPSLTGAPSSRWALVISPGLTVGKLGDLEDQLPMLGKSLVTTVAYRVARGVGVGVELGLATLSADDDDVVTSRVREVLPLNALAVLHLENRRRSWAEIGLGVQGTRVTEATDAWWIAPVLSAQLGYDGWRDGAHRLGLGLRFENTVLTARGYQALSMTLFYRR